MPEENPFENSKERQNPSNAIVAECYQTYDWLKKARGAAALKGSPLSMSLARENLIHARDSIQRAIDHAGKLL